jgi:hypothetical protein
MQILLTGLTTKTITYDTTPDSTVKTLKEFATWWQNIR